MTTELKELKLIVAGGRDFNDYTMFKDALHTLARSKLFSSYGISLVSGMARGADSLAVEYAIYNNIQLYRFPANWDMHGKAAGYIRNAEMARFADVLLAFWDGESRGTSNMITVMRKLGKPTFVVHYGKARDLGTTSS